MTNKTVVVLGPTCTGKTSLAIDLCKRFNGSIISADSRQVVRYMDIGTGKIPAGETNRRLEKLDDRWNLDGVDIFGYDLVNPNEYFSAFNFVQYCQKVFPRVSHDGKNIFMVGGTGFYVDAVIGRMPLAGIGPDIELRKGLEKLSMEELSKKLLELDESVYGKIDTKNPARLIRAIEKVAAKQAGCHSPSQEWAAKLGTRSEKAAAPATLVIGLTAERGVLYSRADKWIDLIFNEKLFEEVKQIQTRFPKSHRLNGLIYKSAVDYLGGTMEIEEAKQRAKFDTHAYIRRQQTWFKRNPQIKWFDVETASIVESELNG